MGRKIESTILPRAFVLIGLMTAVEGCAKSHQNHAQAAVTPPQTNGATTAAVSSTGSSSKSSGSEWADVPINSLPHAQMLTLLDSHDAPQSIPAQEKIAGITADDMEGGRQVWGVLDREKAAAALKSNPTDPPEDAYCVGLTSLATMTFRGSKLGAPVTPPLPESSMLGYVAELGQPQEQINIERIEGDKLTMINGWIVQDGGMRQIGKRDVTMKPLASMSGVDVFAFVEDPPAATSATSARSAKVAAAVDVVIRRPPVRHEHVRGHPFMGVLADGTAVEAACRHIRVALPIIKGDGATATFMLPVETETGVRAVRVNMSSLWLASDPGAHVTARIEWDGPEVSEFPDRRIRSGGRSRSKMGGRF